MARQKKDAKIANFYLSLDTIELLEKYCEETGLSKTVAIERFIKQCTKEYQPLKADETEYTNEVICLERR